MKRRAAEHPDGLSIDQVLAPDDAQQRGLAGPVGAEQQRARPAGDVELDAAQHGHTAITEHEVAHFDNRGFGGAHEPIHFMTMLRTRGMDSR